MACVRGVIDQRYECAVGHDKLFFFLRGRVVLLCLAWRVLCLGRDECSVSHIECFFVGGFAMSSVTTARFWQKTSALLRLHGELFCSGVTSLYWLA